MSATKRPGDVGGLTRGLGAVHAPAAGPPAPAVPAKGKRWAARAQLTLTPEMKQALDMARALDGIPDTARIRAMISLWQDDGRIRARVDKLARSRDA